MQLNVLDISIVDFFDVVLVATFLYQVYRLLRNTMGLRIFYGVIIVFICWKAAQLLDMVLISEIFGGIFSVGFVALIVVFQPELRRFLLTLGGKSFVGRFGKLFKKKQNSLYMQIETIDAIVESCIKFSDDRIGAIIAIQVHEPVKEFIAGGDFADILVTSSILGNIFPKTSNLHDGAVIIVGDRIVRTRAGLPMPEKDIPSSVGFRHRAAIGLCDKTDAICIVVSEDSGYISYIRGRRNILIVNPKQLRMELIGDLHR